MTKEFPNTGPAFSGYNAALDYVEALGYSTGSMQGASPIGLLFADATISKWRNLTKKERDELDGTITFRGGGPRVGTAIVEIRTNP